jgi:hypothetical protein
MNPITGAGLVLEGAGLIVAAWGLRRTLVEAAPGEGVLDPARRLAATARARARSMVAAAVRLVTRRRPPGVTVQAGTAGALIIASKVRARVKYGRLQRSDVVAAVVELERRSNIANTQIADVREKLEDEVERLEAADRDLADRMSGRIGGLEAESRRVTIGDIRTQLTGLALIGVGLVVQTVGQLVG